MRSKWLMTALLAAGSLLTGCAGGGGFVAVGGPPPARYGVVGVAPGPGYVWTDGFWDLRGGHWNWVEGRWMRPPRGNSVWVRSEWRHENGRWRYHRGYWR